MKKLLLSTLISITYSISFAQKVNDSVLISIDTINVYGKLMDELGKPIYNALVLSETLDEDFNYIQTKTDKYGFFKLNGVKPIDRLRFRKEKLAVEYPLNGSRYLVVVMEPMAKLDLNSNKSSISVEAKRVSIKEKYTFKTKNTMRDIGRHPFGYTVDATYPGGLFKFYDFIKTNITYPEKAIKNNIEGMVTIEFTIDRAGNYKDFFVTKDIGYGCSEEVIRVIKKSKKWNSALLGNPIDQKISLAVPFKLFD